PVTQAKSMAGQSVSLPLPGPVAIFVRQCLGAAMSEPIEADILVAGTGPAGMIAALLLAEAGFAVHLAGPPARCDDARTTALMRPALAVLERLGIDPAFGGRAAALRTMRIVDGTSRLIRSPVATFHAAEIDEPEFGR